MKKATFRIEMLASKLEIKYVHRNWKHLRNGIGSKILQNYEKNEQIKHMYFANKTFLFTK